MFKKRRPYRKIAILGLVLLIAGGMYLFFDHRIRPTLFTIAEVEVTQMAVEAMNKVVREETARQDIGYQDFIVVERDFNGRVAIMQANTVRINQFAANITLDVQKELQGLQVKPVSVPLGQMLGGYWFADLGPKFIVRIHPMGTVNVNVIDEFEQAGINQTRHKIYLTFETMVKVVIPISSGQMTIATKIPVAESIIVGDVPEAVINLSGGILGAGK